MNASMRPDDTAWQCNLDAEQALIGAVLVNNAAFFRCADIIEPQHFYEPLHQELWGVLAARISSGGLADVRLVITLIGKVATDQLSGMGVTVGQYIARLAAEAVTVIGAPDYARAVVNYWLRRQIHRIAQNSQLDMMDGPEDANRSIDHIMSELSALRYGKKDDRLIWLGAAADKALKIASTGYQSEGREVIGLQSGLTLLDTMIGPISPGDLITVLAPSETGKTALMTQCLMRAAMSGPSVTALMFQMEMEGVAIARRIMANLTGLGVRAQKTGTMNQAELESMIGGAKQMQKYPLAIDENGRQTIESIEQRIRAMKQLHNIGVVAVDHIGLIRPSHSKMTEMEAIGAGAQRLKEIAKENQVAIFAGAQLTREAQKDAKSWRFNDQALYGGDKVKQASDIMLGVAAPYKWLSQREPDPSSAKDHTEWATKREKWHNRAEIGGLKIRDGGESGSWISVAFDPQYSIFRDG